MASKEEVEVSGGNIDDDIKAACIENKNIEHEEEGSSKRVLDLSEIDFDDSEQVRVQLQAIHENEKQLMATQFKELSQKQRENYSRQFEELKIKMKKGFEDRQQVINNLTSQVSDLKFDNEELTDKSEKLEKQYNELRNKSELEILDLKCKIEGLESLVEQKQSRIDQIQKMFDSSMKRHERGPEDEARAERRRQRELKKQELHKKKEAVLVEEEENENSESGAMKESSAVIEPMEENVTSPKAEDIQKEIHNQLKKSAQQQVDEITSQFQLTAVVEGEEMEEKEVIKPAPVDRKKPVEPKKSTKRRSLYDKGSAKTESDTKQFNDNFKGSYVLVGINQKLSCTFDKKEKRNLKVKKLKSQYPTSLGIREGDLLYSLNGKALGGQKYEKSMKYIKAQPQPWTIQFVRP